MKKIILLISFALSLMADPFTQGSTSIGLKIGSASTNLQNYTLAGISGNYFVIDNLSVGMGYEYWFSGDPSVQKITLESTYFIPVHEKFLPYVGALYRHILISDENAIESFGYRAGISLVQDNFLVSVGFVQEFYTQNSLLFGDSQIYPELVVGVSF